MKPAARYRRHRGFMLFVAVTLIAFVGVALAVLTQSLAANAKNTDGQSADAQLRQLLTAGELTARAMIERNQLPGNGSSVELPLPRELRERKAVLSLQMVGDGQDVTSQISARIGARQHASSVIRWHHDGGGWQVASMGADER